MRRLNPRGAASVSVAVLLVLVGVARWASDIAADAHRDDPDYWRRLAASPLWFLRYVLRTPSDGTFLGDLNIQWFKLLSIPCATSLVYLWFRRRYGSLRAGARRFADPRIRLLWVATFFVAFLLIELDKEFRIFGTTAPELRGETFWKNQLAHVVSAVAAWFLLARYSFAPVFVPDDASRGPPGGPREGPKPP
jgi:hypothetical protein